MISGILHFTLIVLLCTVVLINTWETLWNNGKSEACWLRNGFQSSLVTISVHYLISRLAVNEGRTNMNMFRHGS